MICIGGMLYVKDPECLNSNNGFFSMTDFSCVPSGSCISYRYQQILVRKKDQVEKVYMEIWEFDLMLCFRRNVSLVRL